MRKLRTGRDVGLKKDLQNGMCFFIEVTIGETIDVHPEIQGLLAYPGCPLLNHLVTPGLRVLKGRPGVGGCPRGGAPNRYLF